MSLAASSSNVAKRQSRSKKPASKKGPAVTDLLDSSTIYSRDVAQWSIPNKDEELELAIKARRGDSNARDQLVVRNLRLVPAVARIYKNRGIDFEDLIQEGNMGLMTAAGNFDYTPGCKFATHAIHWIKRAMRNVILSKRETIRVPTHMNEWCQKVLGKANELEALTGKTPEPEDIANLLEEPVSKVEEAFSALNTRYPISLSQSFLPSLDESPLEVVVADKKSLTPSTLLQAKEEREIKLNKIQNLLDGIDQLKMIPDRDPKIFRNFYGLNDGSFSQKTLDDTGNYFNLSRERVRQIIKEIWIRMAPQTDLNHDSLLCEIERIFILENLTGEEAILPELRQSF